MTGSPADHAAEIALEIQRLVSGITVAKRELASGSLIDFKAIEEDIATICRRAEKLPREESRTLLPAMVNLGDEFDMLIGLLAHLQATEAEAEAEISRRRAQEAYGKGQG